MTQTPLWQPSKDRLAKSNMQQFMLQTNAKYQLNMQSYADLHLWSVENLATFWDEIWHLADVQAQHKGHHILENPELMPGAKWFPEARLNYAENLLKFRDHKTAIIFCGEDG